MDPEENSVLVRLVAEVKRLDDLRVAGEERLSNSLKDHVDYTKQRFDSEMKRLAAIRGDDTGNVAKASAAASETAAGLAKQLVDTEASARALVASTAEAAARRQESFASHVETRFGVLNDKIADSVGKRDREINKSEGRSGISTPLLVTLAASLAALAGAFIMWILKISLTTPILK